jgi:hypothetical protein
MHQKVIFIYFEVNFHRLVLLDITEHEQSAASPYAVALRRGNVLTGLLGVISSSFISPVGSYTHPNSK